MLVRDDKKHKRTRRASQPAFKNDALKTYVEMMNPIQERRIQDLPVNEQFIFHDNIHKPLMDVAGEPQKYNIINSVIAVMSNILWT